MSHASRSFIASNKYKRVGPDYFGYYTSEVVNILSQEEDVSSVSTQALELSESKHEEARKKNLVRQSDNCSSPLYSNGVGVELSDFRKERLKSLLRQSVTILSSEVDELTSVLLMTLVAHVHLRLLLVQRLLILLPWLTTTHVGLLPFKKVVDPVFAAYHLQSKLKSKSHSMNDTTTVSNNVVQIPSKSLKVSSTSSSDMFLEQTNDVNLKCNRKTSDDVQFLLENDSVEVTEMVKKYSNELSTTLGYMEEQLELLLDTIMLKCRSMTIAEKQQLQSLIQKLPARNLNRVVELICRKRPVEEQSCDEIFVDLEKEDNATLWRLYYYVQAVEKAKSLSCSQEA